MLLNELKAEFQQAMQKELAPGEQMLWAVQPDPEGIPASLLLYSVLWLSGLFLMAVALLRNSDADASSILPYLIFMLVLVAVVGAAELIFLPMRAARTLYVVTDKRVFAMSTSAYAGGDTGGERKVLRNYGDNRIGFYMINIPAQILLVLFALDVVAAMARHFDGFFASGFGLMLAGWTYPWIQDLNIPLAKYRDAPRTLYLIDDLYVSVRELPRDHVKAVKLRRIRRGLFNAVIISDDLGCLRLRAIARGEVAQDLLQGLGFAPNQKFPFD